MCCFLLGGLWQDQESPLVSIHREGGHLSDTERVCHQLKEEWELLNTWLQQQGRSTQLCKLLPASPLSRSVTRPMGRPKSDLLHHCPS